MTDSQTIPDVHSIARDQLRAFVQRVERIEEEIKTLNDDKSDIYKEAAAVGFDKKTLKKVVARRKVDDSQRQEEDALFEMYWDAVHGTNLVHARVRENIEQFSASDGSPSVSSSLTTREAEESVVSISAGSSSGKASDFGSEDAGSIPAPASSSDQPGEGGADEVASSAMRAGLADPTSNTGEGAASALPAKPKVSFRPNCQHPENCASGTRDHCWSCRRAMQKSEEMA